MVSSQRGGGGSLCTITILLPPLLPLLLLVSFPPFSFEKIFHLFNISNGDNIRFTDLILWLAVKKRAKPSMPHTEMVPDL